jgi:hypothetical protein
MSLLAGLIVGLTAVSTAQARTPVALRAQPPEISHQSEDQWVNSKPLKLADLHGQVVVVNFWTFG